MSCDCHVTQLSHLCWCARIGPLKALPVECHTKSRPAGCGTHSDVCMRGWGEGLADSSTPLW